MTELTKDQVGRAVGSVLASAVGDALGSAYEFGPPHEDSWRPTFAVGHFGHGVGEWTDDTSMAIPILEWVADEGNLPRRHILERWLEWSVDSKDVGILTRAVLQRLKHSFTNLESAAKREAKNIHDFNGKTAGNGSLMRIGPYALKNIFGKLDVEELTELTRWTHYDEDNIVACRIWLEAIRSCIITGKLDLEAVANKCELEVDSLWWQRLEAVNSPGVRARDFGNNGWVVEALQGALAAIISTDNLVDALEEAIRGGGDTDTVAAIAGSLAGALYGAEQIPPAWRETIYGWPGYDATTLELLAIKALRRSET